jgi:nucleolar protein 56
MFVRLRHCKMFCSDGMGFGSLQALYLLHESASGYSLFEAYGLDEIGQSADAVQESVLDLNRFGKVVKLVAFKPYSSAADALEQCNAVSEGILTQDLHNFLELNLPKVKVTKKAKFSVGVAEPKLGSAILEATHIPCQSNDFVQEFLRGIRLHFNRFIKDLKVVVTVKKFHSLAYCEMYSLCLTLLAHE